MRHWVAQASTWAWRARSAAAFIVMCVGVAIFHLIVPYAEAQQLAAPRFASLKTDKVVVRRGPDKAAPAVWTYHRLGWPVEVLREQDGFSEIRDNDGAMGWVSSLHLSGRRTVLVLSPQTLPARVTLRTDSSETARPAAELEGGLQAEVIACDGRWCRLKIDDVTGWLEQGRLWGVYAGERFK